MSTRQTDFSLFNYTRRETIPVKVGSLTLGGGNPIRVQSMTNTSTMDTEGSVAQIQRIVERGGELVRLTTQGSREAINLGEIKKAVRDLISISKVIAKEELRFEKDPESMDRKELEKLIADVQKKMQKAAADLNFEAAAELRDKMIELKQKLAELDE